MLNRLVWNLIYRWKAPPPPPPPPPNTVYHHLSPSLSLSLCGFFSCLCSISATHPPAETTTLHLHPLHLNQIQSSCADKAKKFTSEVISSRTGAHFKVSETAALNGNNETAGCVNDCLLSHCLTRPPYMSATYRDISVSLKIPCSHFIRPPQSKSVFKPQFLK